MSSVLKAIWRSGGSVMAGAALAAALSSPWGLVLTPALAGLSKSLKKSYDLRGKPVPGWLGLLPF